MTRWTCVHCRKAIGRAGLYCSQACSDQSRQQIIQASLDSKHGRGTFTVAVTRGVVVVTGG